MSRMFFVFIMCLFAYRLKNAVWFVLEPLMTKNDNFSFSFYKTFVEKMKTHKDKVDPEDDAVNYVRSRELKKSALNFSCLIYPLCRNCGPSATSSCLCSSARPQTLSSRNSQPR